VCFTIKLLGSLDARLHDHPVAPSAAKQRQLLALLAMNAGRAVSVSTIMTELWGPEQSKGAGTTLHSYVGKLRHEFELAARCGWCRDAKKILVTEPTGYSLRVPASNIDVARYEQLADAGRRAADSGDYDTASRSLSSALALWRGPALADIVPGQHLMVEMVRLEESRLSDLDLRLECDLQLGRHRRLLGELAGLCARFPMSENLATKYMLALYRSGQQWRALEIYQRLRSTMSEELGVDPSAPMQRLHLAMLNGDPSVDAPTPARLDWLDAG
jgi:DNA-binding SARP family transcriptional activator